MKIDASFFAALIVTGTTLLVRASIQGFVPVLLSAAIEYWNGIRAAARQ